MSTTQYSDIEPVTSVTHLPIAGGSGEAYTGPIVKQLQRAHQIAKENAQ